jgi:hypothetical protein
MVSTFPWRWVLGNQSIMANTFHGYRNERCFHGDRFLETIHQCMIKRYFLGYEMERCFLCPSNLHYVTGNPVVVADQNGKN